MFQRHSSWRCRNAISFGDPHRPRCSRAAPARPPRARRSGQRPPARLGQRARRPAPRGSGKARGDDRADAWRLGPSLQRGGCRGLAGPASIRPSLCLGRGPAGCAQGACPARPGPEKGRLRRLACPRPLRRGRASLRRPLPRGRDAQAAQGSRPLLAEGPAGPPRGRSEGAGEVQKALPDLIEGLAREHTGERVELWFMDEARVGQKGRVTHVWYQKGVRPRGVRQQGFSSAHPFGAVCPERGEGVALVLPEVSVAAMNLFLGELAAAVPAGAHAALVLDGAGWHVGEDLAVPANLTLVPSPPYSPELVWGFACQALTIAAS